jgi:2-polyprenyl-3-methyl-5-hydroxy-6-metoxy-1,4-benzoquinol methylase
VPRFPVRRWWETEELCEIERVYFDAVRGAERLLDVGAGDLRIMRKLQRAGFRGEYHTQDVGSEGAYTYRSLDEARGQYGAILCLDVIEHLSLRDGLAMLKKMISLLAPGGVLVLQTPNASYIPDPRSWDMTHVQTYNAGDLWAWLKCEGLEPEIYRVVLRGSANPGPIVSAKAAVTGYVKRKILGCDDANNIAAIARKPG